MRHGVLDTRDHEDTVEDEGELARRVAVTRNVRPGAQPRDDDAAQDRQDAQSLRRQTYPCVVVDALERGEHGLGRYR